MQIEQIRVYPFLRILWEPEIGAVHMRWRGPVGGQEFRDALLRGLRTAEKKGASRWLEDLRRLGMINRADQQWLDDEWFPKAIEVGIRWVARVNPESSKTQVSIRELMQLEHAQAFTEASLVEVNAYETVPEARAWLMSVED